MAYKFATFRIADRCIQTFSEHLKCEIMELNVQADHVQVLVMIPPKLAVSDYVGTVKGRTAIRVLNRFRALRRKPYWGNHFWTKGYCVDTVAWMTKRDALTSSTRNTASSELSKGN